MHFDFEISFYLLSAVSPVCVCMRLAHTHTRAHLFSLSPYAEFSFCRSVDDGTTRRKALRTRNAFFFLFYRLPSASVSVVFDYRVFGQRSTTIACLRTPSLPADLCGERRFILNNESNRMWSKRPSPNCLRVAQRD